MARSLDCYGFEAYLDRAAPSYPNGKPLWRAARDKLLLYGVQAWRGGGTHRLR